MVKSKSDLKLSTAGCYFMKVDMTGTLGEDVKKYLNQGAQIDFREFREKNKIE